MKICGKNKNHLIHIIRKGLQCEGMTSLPWFAFTFFVYFCWQNVLELLQGNDSNSLNVKEFVHKAWLDMIKFNAPNHKLEKWNVGDKVEM